MKKVLCTLLSIAMVLSCLSMVSFAASVLNPATTETVLDVNFSDSSAYGYAPTGNAVYPMTDPGVVTLDDSHGDAYKFTAKNSWTSPVWRIAPLIKTFAEKHPGKDVLVNVSADFKAENSVVNLLFRDASNGSQKTIKSGVAGEWNTGTWSKTFTEAEISLLTDEYRLCVDNIKGASGETPVDVYLDNIVVTLTAYDEAIGVEFTTKASNSFDRNSASSVGAEIAQMIPDGFTGTKVFNFMVYNVGSTPINNGYIYIQAGWDSIVGAKNNFPKLQPGEVGLATISIPFENGSVMAKPNSGDAYAATASKFTLRFQDFNKETVGTKFIVYPLELSVETVYGVTTTGCLESKAYTFEQIPYKGIKFTASQNINNSQVMSSTEGGYLSDVVIENGMITKNITVYNTGSNNIKVKAAIQALTQNSAGSNTWSGPSSAASGTYTIAPGEAQDYSLSLNVSNGMIDIPGCASKDVSAFFIRFDVTCLSGDTFVVADEDAPKGFLAKFGSNVTTEYVEQLPVKRTPTPAPTATPAPTPTPDVSELGVKVTTTDKQYYFRKNVSTFIQNDINKRGGTAFSGDVTYSFDIYNTGSVAFGISAYIQGYTTGTAGWDSFALVSTKKSFDLQPGQVDTISITVKVVNGVVIDKDEKYPQEFKDLTLRFDTVNSDDKGTKYPGAEFIIVSNELPVDAVKGLSSLTYGAKVTELPNYATPTPKPVETPTPAPKIELVNGDAESGNTNGWTKFSSGGGSVSVANEGANGTAHSIKFNIGGGQYDSIGFNLAPAIVQNAQAGYYGEGDGAYKITFWAKAEEGKSGVFGFVLNSQWHRSAGQIDPSFPGTPVNSYISYTTGEVTDTWQKYTTVVEVDQNFLDELNFLYETNKAACDLILRLDGSGAAKAFKNGENLFSYYVDEVTIEKMDVKITNAANDGALTVVSGAVAKDANTFYTTKYATVLLKYNGNDEFAGIDVDGKKFDRRENNTAYISVGEDDVVINYLVTTVDADSKYAVFYNATGAVIGEVDFTEGVTASDIPAAPARKGMAFDGYKFNGTVYANAAALVAAMNDSKVAAGSYAVSLVYAANSYYTVTINDTPDATINGVVTTEDYIEPFQLVKVTAPAEKAGQKFLYWADENGEQVSTFNNYSFYVIDHNVTLKAVYGAGEVPVVNYLEITTAEKNGDGSLTMIAERAFDSKVTLKANGIMFIESDNNDMSASELETQFSNLYNGAAVVGGKKVTSKYTNRLGSYVLTKKTTTAGKTYYVCAWATYLDEKGDEQVMLSNVMSTEGANVEINFITVG